MLVDLLVGVPVYCLVVLVVVHSVSYLVDQLEMILSVCSVDLSGVRWVVYLDCALVALKADHWAVKTADVLVFYFWSANLNLVDLLVELSKLVLTLAALSLVYL